MAALVWDAVGEHRFEIGVDHGILFPVKNGKYQTGVAWNGLTAVTESPEGAEPNDQYADNIKYLTLRSTETFNATIEAFTYPDEFLECDGTLSPMAGVHFGQQTRTPFGFAYRTKVGNDVQGMDAGYILHLIYGCTVSPAERSYQTVNDSPEAMTFSWELDSTPVQAPGYKPVSSVTINSTEVSPEMMARIEAVLCGSVTGDPRLPMPDEIPGILSTPMAFFKVSVPDESLEVGNRTIADFIDDVKVDDEAGAMSGTVKKVRGWSGPGPSVQNISNYILPVKLEQDPGKTVRLSVKSKDGGVLATLKGRNGIEYVIVPKNHDGAYVRIQQSDSGDLAEDVTVEQDYDLSGIAYEESSAPADQMEPSTTSTYIKQYMDEKHPDKTVDDLQSNLVIRNTGDASYQLEGTVHYVTGFTSFYDKESPDGRFAIFRFAPKDKTHRIGCKGSEAKGGNDSVFDANDFIVLARLDGYMEQEDHSLTVYEYAADGQQKLNTFTFDLDTLTFDLRQ